MYRRVLIATDGSSTADRAARKGFELAETLEAPVTIVFVGHPKTGELITQDTIATYAGEVKTDVLLREGDPAAQILAAADDIDAGLVVVGNKGMVGAKGFLLGSVPQEVCERSTRDVLIARTVTQVVSELAPGEGGIVERAGEKLAVYVGEDAETHVMSARCTHMGCTVKWNPGEHTFDCPCHGSRFGPTGEVVNGPGGAPAASRVTTASRVRSERLEQHQVEDRQQPHDPDRGDHVRLARSQQLARALRRRRAARRSGGPRRRR